MAEGEDKVGQPGPEQVASTPTQATKPTKAESRGLWSRVTGLFGRGKKKETPPPVPKPEPAPAKSAPVKSAPAEPVAPKPAPTPPAVATKPDATVPNPSRRELFKKAGTVAKAAAGVAILGVAASGPARAEFDETPESLRRGSPEAGTELAPSPLNGRRFIISGDIEPRGDSLGIRGEDGFYDEVKKSIQTGLVQSGWKRREQRRDGGETGADDEVYLQMSATVSSVDVEVFEDTSGGLVPAIVNETTRRVPELADLGIGTLQTSEREQRIERDVKFTFFASLLLPNGDSIHDFEFDFRDDIKALVQYDSQFSLGVYDRSTQRSGDAEKAYKQEVDRFADVLAARVVAAMDDWVRKHPGEIPPASKKPAHSGHEHGEHDSDHVDHVHAESAPETLEVEYPLQPQEWQQYQKARDQGRGTVQGVQVVGGKFYYYDIVGESPALKMVVLAPTNVPGRAHTRPLDRKKEVHFYLDLRRR